MVLAGQQRARSSEQKRQRRESILGAAKLHLSDVGFEKFSMSTLCRLSGVAKGTLYLYFETREEVLLALFLSAMEQWSQRFAKSSYLWISDEAFVQDYYSNATLDSEFLQLMSRLDTVIEHNVSLPVLIDSKRQMGTVIQNVSSVMALKLSLTNDQALDVNRSFAALLMGAVQGDLGPQLEHQDIPADVQNLMNLFSSRSLFVTNAGRILQAIRIETPVIKPTKSI